MRSPRLTIFLLGVFLLPASKLGAQGQQAPLTRDASHITIEAIAVDKQGHPLPGLSEQDFAILDNGQPRKITGFKAVSPSNDAEEEQVLIVLDTINTSFGEVAQEREQLSEYLNQNGGKLAAPTGIAVMSETGVKMMQGAVADGHALQTAFQTFNSGLRAIGRTAGFYGATDRLQWSLEQLSQILSVEASRPGRKMVLVISPGWPLLAATSYLEDDKERGWIFNLVTHITNALREGHIALYSLNPYMLGRSDPFLYESYLKGVKNPDHAEYPYLALPVFSVHSGGQALTAGKDVRGEINAAMRDTGPYYELTFPVPAVDRPNEFHDLQVKVARPGLTVRTTKFYYAAPRPVNANDKLHAQPSR